MQSILKTPSFQNWTTDFEKRVALNWANIRTGLLLWIVFLVFLSLVQFSTPDLPDNDGYYHIKLAFLMRTEGLTPEFNWLPLSILNAREYYDHHFLFHVALIPFTFGNLIIGAKLAAVFFASLAFMSVWNLFRNQKIPLAPFWAFGLMAVSEAFIYRMSITRAQSLSLIVLMVGLDWLLRKKYKRLVFLGFFYVWLYNAFPLLLVLAGGYVAVNWLFTHKLELQPLLYASIGIGLGMVINPFFPYNIIFTTSHILPKLFETTSISVGSEWYPYTTSQILKNSLFALVAFISGAFALGFHSKRMEMRTAVSFVLAVLFGLMLFQSRRFIEYFPAFALIFAAFAWTPIIQSAMEQASNRFYKWLPSMALIAILIPGIWLTQQSAQASIQKSKPFQTYAESSAWLSANTPSGSRVFQTDWDDFPRLFFYNSQNTYLIGLDPTYMLYYNQDLYDTWVDITKGRIENPSAMIAGNFGSDYVLSDLKHTNFLKGAAKDPGLIEVFRSEDSVVYQVVLQD
ncbi:MAG: hypothetical protein IH585_16885 [Anaerolineaceae bacterium]|nr:hypothetical protein [Anaerolineaceae bacterium]